MHLSVLRLATAQEGVGVTWLWLLVAVLAAFLFISYTNAQRARARRHHRVSITPSERSEAFYKALGPALKERKTEAAEFYDVEKEGL